MRQAELQRESDIPFHVGLIMDGNGRWAEQRGLPRSRGHKEGLSAAKRIAAAASKLGIGWLTLYTFSTENWKRTQEEIGFLMNLVKIHLRAEFAFYRRNNIRVSFVGDMAGLPQDVAEELAQASRDTEHFSGTRVVLAINYGGRNEIARACRSLADREGIDALSEEGIRAEMETALPDADLIIRTGGEKRLSNFLLWQSAYAELFFSDTLWPDYTEQEFISTITEFSRRTRRFGGN